MGSLGGIGMGHCGTLVLMEVFGKKSSMNSFMLEIWMFHSFLENSEIILKIFFGAT